MEAPRHEGRSVFGKLVFFIVLKIEANYTLNMDVAVSFEILVTMCQTTWCHITDSSFNTRICVNKMQAALRYSIRFVLNYGGLSYLRT